jgi:hypothetical protein
VGHRGRPEEGLWFDSRRGRRFPNGFLLKQPGMSDNKDDPAISEWVVGVKWEKTFERDEAKRFPGIFANQNIVCLLRDTATADFLRKEFGIAS